MLKEVYLTTPYANEDQFQAATFEYINHNYPSLRKLIFHVPNGGMRSQREAMKFKAMGLLPGCPDLVCVCPLFGLELKMPNGVQSATQKQVEQIWTGAGVPYFIAYGPQQVIDTLNHLNHTPCPKD